MPSESSLSRVVLITGASSGLGRSCAERLAAEGYRVYGTSRRATWPKAGAFEDSPPNLPILIPMDVSDEDSVTDGIHRILEREGRLDIVVNNAGIGIAGSIENTSVGEARALFETNFFGVHRVCRAALPAMRARRSGLIVNISSLAGRVTIPFQGFYSASKYSLEALTEALRMEVAALGVRVTMIEPGDFATGFTDARVVAGEARGNSAYTERCDAAVAVMEHDERNGAAPELVAELLLKIISTESPRLRYPVGMRSQRFGAALGRFLPASLLERALKALYKL
jgi:NAD(P)-dependent dehydrogenase (short-subunit alcohol dehydrogenase family)